MDVFRIYISAASDLRAEREILAKAITDVPVSLGWELRQTPLGSHEQLDLDSLRATHWHILLLGGDVRAPVGVEWALAQSTGQIPHLHYRSSIPRTPAAASFFNRVRQTAAWQPYSSLIQIRQQVMRHVARALKAGADYFKLTGDDYSNLLEWEAALSENDDPLDAEIGGAGSSAVVFSPERYVPSSGVLIKAEPDKDELTD